MLEYRKNQTDTLLNDLGYDLLEECRRAVSIAGIDPGTAVLDVATGSGRMASILSDAGLVVYASDINCDAFLRLRDRLGDLVARGITFIQSDAGRMPFPDESFKAIVCANALHEMDDPASVLSEMMRVCSRDGKLVVTDFNDNGMDIMAEIHRRTNRGEHSRGTITAQEVGHMLSSGFTQVRHENLPLNDVWIASGKIASRDADNVHSGCFACGNSNPQGLGLSFEPIGKHRIRAECILGEEYQGYPGILQGGVVSTLLDSAMTNCLFADGVEAMTVRLSVRFREPVYVNRAMTVAACLVRQRGRFYELKASIMQDGGQKAYAEAKFLGDKAGVSHVS